MMIRKLIDLKAILRACEVLYDKFVVLQGIFHEASRLASRMLRVISFGTSQTLSSRPQTA
jgi:hypothetical protein